MLYESTRAGVPEVALWRAVIAIHINDIMVGRAEEAKVALNWVFGSSAGFKRVCDLAMLDFEYVRDRVRELMDLKMNKAMPANFGKVCGRTPERRSRRGQVRNVKRG
jgi:hypothetical protein